jgi:NAD-dependent SIR2 family protein deacetylase
VRKNTEQHEKITKLRSMGMSLRSIAEECGLSIPRVHQILNPYNAEGAFISYTCNTCGANWSSKARTKPKRCPSCGTHFWSGSGPASKGASGHLTAVPVDRVEVVDQSLTPQEDSTSPKEG